MEIYKITNLINGKIYIGKTCKTANERFKRHVRGSKGDIKNSDYFHQALRKYGENNFKIDILESNITDKDTLNKREIYWIAKYNSTNNKIGYNLALGGTGGPMAPEIYKAIGLKLKGRKQLKEHINKRVKTFKENKANIGIKNGVNNPGVKEKISNSLKEYYRESDMGEITKKKISNSLKEYYKNNNHVPWNKNKTNCYDITTREKISNSLKEYYKNNPNAPPFKGKHHSDKTKKELSKKLSNKRWYNDGINTYFCEEDIALLNGYIKGRLNYKKKRG